MNTWIFSSICVAIGGLLIGYAPAVAHHVVERNKTSPVQPFKERFRLIQDEKPTAVLFRVIGFAVVIAGVLTAVFH